MDALYNRCFKSRENDPFSIWYRIRSRDSISTLRGEWLCHSAHLYCLPIFIWKLAEALCTRDEEAIDRAMAHTSVLDLKKRSTA